MRSQRLHQISGVCCSQLRQLGGARLLVVRELSGKVLEVVLSRLLGCGKLLRQSLCFGVVTHHRCSRKRSGLVAQCGINDGALLSSRCVHALFRRCKRFCMLVAQVLHRGVVLARKFRTPCSRSVVCCRDRALTFGARRLDIGPVLGGAVFEPRSRVVVRLSCSR